MEQHDRDDRQGAQALDVGAELVVGDAVELVAHGTSSGDVWRHPIVQVDASRATGAASRPAARPVHAAAAPRARSPRPAASPSPGG